MADNNDSNGPGSDGPITIRVGVPYLTFLGVALPTPALPSSSHSGEFGSAARVVLQSVRGSSGSCIASLSADLILKE